MGATLASHPKMRRILAIAQALEDGGLPATTIGHSMSDQVAAQVRSAVHEAEAICAHLLPKTPFDGIKGDPHRN